MQQKIIKRLLVGALCVGMLCTSIPVYAEDDDLDYYGYDDDDYFGDYGGYVHKDTKKTPTYSISGEDGFSSLKLGEEYDFTVSTNSDGTAGYWVYDSAVDCTIVNNGSGEYTYKITPKQTGEYNFRVQFVETSNFEAINYLYQLKISDSPSITQTEITIGDGSYDLGSVGYVGDEIKIPVSVNTAGTPYVCYRGYSDFNKTFDDSLFAANIVDGNLVINATKAGDYTVGLKVDAGDGYTDAQKNYKFTISNKELNLKVNGNPNGNTVSCNVGDSVVFKISSDVDTDFDISYRGKSKDYVSYNWDKANMELTITALKAGNYKGVTLVSKVDSSKTVYCQLKISKKTPTLSVTHNGTEVGDSLDLDGKTEELGLSSDSDASFKCTSEDGSIVDALVSGSSVKLIPKKKGETTVTVSTAATDKYSPAKKTFTVNVLSVPLTKTSLTLSSNGETTSTDESQTFTVSTNSDSEIKYSLSDKSVAEVTLTDKTFTVKPLKEGEVDIKVYQEANDSFSAASATYTANFRKDRGEAKPLSTGWIYNDSAGRIFNIDLKNNKFISYEDDKSLQFSSTIEEIDKIDGSNSEETAYILYCRVDKTGDSYVNYKTGNYVAVAITYYMNTWRCNLCTTGIQSANLDSVKSEVNGIIDKYQNDDRLTAPISAKSGYPNYPFYVYNKELSENGQIKGSPRVYFVKWAITKGSVFTSEVKKSGQDDSYFYPPCVYTAEKPKLKEEKVTIKDENGKALDILNVPVSQINNGIATVEIEKFTVKDNKDFGGYYQNGKLCYTYTKGGKYYTTISIDDKSEITVKYVDADYIIEGEVKTFDNTEVKAR